MSTHAARAEANASANFLSAVTKQLSKVLTNNEDYTAAFRIHNKQLPTLGELSFQTNLQFAAWKALAQPASKDSKEKCTNIFEYASKQHNKVINEDTIPRVTEEINPCGVKIAKCSVIRTNCHVFLNRAFVTENILSAILKDNNYGSYVLNSGVKVIKSSESNDSVSELRVKILHDIVQHFIGSEAVSPVRHEILLTTKSSDTRRNKILCGCVLNNSGHKEETLTSSDLYDEYASNMRMMFEHKFGVRNITDKPNWQQKIDKLGHAAVTFQMIQNTPQKTVALSSKHHVIKDAAFVVYNAARISSILRRFRAEFPENSLPEVNQIDFANLKLDEEWELIYAFLVQYPSVIKNCVCFLEEGKLNFHKLYEFLVHFSTAFSCYYSRIKIITEGKVHLLPTLHARIYLLQSIERVLQHAMRLLNIELVNQM